MARLEHHNYLQGKKIRLEIFVGKISAAIALQCDILFLSLSFPLI